jgi:excisionase family DNA binding protein
MNSSDHSTDAVGRRAKTPKKDDAKTVPIAQRLTCSVSEACQITGISRAKLYQLISDGSLGSTTVGRRRLIYVRALRGLLLMGE